MTSDFPRAVPMSSLASPATRKLLTRYIARRVAACDVDDVVQSTLCDALASGRAPEGGDDLRRWLLAIARFKVVDAHRAGDRTTGETAADLPAPAPPLEAMSLLRWAERQLPRGTEPTLRWMLREAEGEKLESIAADELVPAERVRKRVSRLRKWMRERWAAEIAVALVLALVSLSVLRAGARRREIILPEMATEVAARDARLIGTWQLVSFSPAAPLSPTRQAITDRLAPSFAVTFDGTTFAASAAEGAFQRNHAALHAGGGRIDAIDPIESRRASATYAWEGDELLVTIPTGTWAGKARLKRAR